MLILSQHFFVFNKKIMQIIILPKNIDIDKKAEDYITKKMESLEKMLSKDSNVSCEFRIGKNSVDRKNKKAYFAEAKILTPKKVYGARSDEETMFEAIDFVKDELLKKIRRHKDKRISSIKKGGRIFKNLMRKFSIK